MSGRHRKAFSNLQSCLTDSSWIHLILLIKLIQYKQVRHSSLCRAVQDGFLLSDLPDLRLLLVKLIAQTQANTCLSCPISCSTTPGVMRTSSAHVIHACRPHVIHASSTRHPHVICACAYVVRTRTHHPHIIYTSSALLPMVSMGLNYLLLWQEFVIEWNLWQECWIVAFQDHVNDLRDNLCCWFSLHVKSGHCSHLICICTCHLHIIWAYAYYAHIICSGPWYLPS